MSKKKIQEVDELVDLIKNLWPQFQVTRDDILNPSSDLALKFYTQFISHCQERLPFLLGSATVVETNADLDNEERVYQIMSKMSNIFDLVAMEFLLVDIYEPTFLRNKNFFRVCTHSMKYYESIAEEAESLGHDVLQMKDEGNRLKENEEHLLEHIAESKKKAADLIGTIHKLSTDLKMVKERYDECMDLKLQKDGNLTVEKKQIDMLKCELQKEENELVALKKKENKLEEQTITETEYRNSLQLLDNLENEIKLLGNDDVHVTDFLTQANDVLRHYEMCNKRVPDISDFKAKPIEKLIELEDQLQDLQLSTKTLSNTKLCPTRHLVIQRKKQKEEIIGNLIKSQAQLVSLENQISKDKENVLAEVNHFKHVSTRKLLSCEADISKYNEKIYSLSSKMNKMKKISQNEYARVCQAENQVFDKFSAWFKEHVISL